MLFLKQQQFCFIVQFQIKTNNIIESSCSFIAKMVSMLILYLAFKIHPRVSGSCAAVKYRTLDGRGLCCERTCM